MDLQSGKYLTFHLTNEEYGIPIQKVKEIIGIMDITHIPKVPTFIKGVINLRGKIIPVMDLRLKFELNAQDYNQRTCIIITELGIEDMKRQIGIIVDTISEVVNVQKTEIEPPPQYGSNTAGSSFLQGMGNVKDKVILLLDIDKVFNNNELVIVPEI